MINFLHNVIFLFLRKMSDFGEESDVGELEATPEVPPGHEGKPEVPPGHEGKPEPLSPPVYEEFSKISSEVLTQLENIMRALNQIRYRDYKNCELNEMLQIFKQLNHMKQDLYVIDTALNHIIYEFRNIADFTKDGVVIKIKDFQHIGSTLPMANALYSCLKDAPTIKDINDLITRLSDETKAFEERQRDLYRRERILKRQHEQLNDFINTYGKRYEPFIHGDDIKFGNL